MGFMFRKQIGYSLNFHNNKLVNQKIRIILAYNSTPEIHLNPGLLFSLQTKLQKNICQSIFVNLFQESIHQFRIDYFKECVQDFIRQVFMF